MGNIITDKVILGVDPGTTVMGYGLVAVRRPKVELIQFGVIHLSKYNDHALKLQKIFERVSGLIDEYNPDEVALEAPFFGKNVQSMLKLGRAQGVAMAAALSRSIPIAEYAPRKIKQSVTGNGNASKEQVAKMLMSLFAIQELPKLLDATDALAVAVCHHFQAGKAELTAGSASAQRPQTKPRRAASSWESFLKENPDRIKPA
nr:crossover junction endodeoxyribonuclease RuvC [Dawidia soli]